MRVEPKRTRTAQHFYTKNEVDKSTTQRQSPEKYVRQTNASRLRLKHSNRELRKSCLSKSLKSEAPSKFINNISLNLSKLSEERELFGKRLREQKKKIQLEQRKALRA